jgi:uncharacterized protein (DUF983 family)
MWVALYRLVGLVTQACRCRCPRCGVGPLYRGRFSLELWTHCYHCHLNLVDNDTGDGPAVFLIFLLGFLLVPLALWVDWVWALPLWAHAVLFGAAALVITLGLLKPLKSLVLHIQFRTRPETWHS